LRRAAILHDVGKLGVSSAILEKPGKLDTEEWREMHTHAEHTTHILSQIGVMHDMALIAGSHHERLDGKGYPLGLDARSISLESRIITVADIFDALTADFVRHGFDLRFLMRRIVSSRAYQLSSAATPQNARDDRYYSHFLVRRMTAETLLDMYKTALGLG